MQFSSVAFVLQKLYCTEIFKKKKKVKCFAANNILKPLKTDRESSNMVKLKRHLKFYKDTEMLIVVTEVHYFASYMRYETPYS